MKDIKGELLEEAKEMDKDKRPGLIAASQLKQDSNLYVRKQNKIKTVRLALGDNVILECSHCAHKQNLGESLSMKCRACGRLYKIWPRGNPSRVFYCPKKLVPTLLYWQGLMQGGKIRCIL